MSLRSQHVGFFLFFFFFSFSDFSDRCAGCLPCVTRLVSRVLSSPCPLSHPYGAVCRSALRVSSFPSAHTKKNIRSVSKIKKMKKGGRLVLISHDEPCMMTYIYFFLTFWERVCVLANRCKPGFFNLQPVNPEGCQPCFCLGHSLACSSSNHFAAVAITSDFMEGIISGSITAAGSA